MGLHDSLLDVPERLRVWQLAGVRHFYLTPGPAGEPAPAGPPEDSTPEAGPASPAVAPAGVFAGGQPAAAGSSRTVAQPEPARADPPAPLPADPSRWPAPWPAIFAKAPATPRLVVTYPDLGLDLTGRADPRRGNLWRALIRELGLAGQNAVAFWPAFLPDAAGPAARDDIFLAGLRLLRPRVLAVFGDDPDRLLPPAALPGLVRETLPDARVLLDGDTEAWDHVIEVLGRLL